MRFSDNRKPKPVAKKKTALERMVLCGTGGGAGTDL